MNRNKFEEWRIDSNAGSRQRPIKYGRFCSPMPQKLPISKS